VVACRAAECANLAGRARHRCLNACRTRSHCAVPGAGIGTVGLFVTRCRQDPDGTSWFGQQLMVRRGNRPPVTALDLPLTRRGYDPVGLCRLYGESRWGPYANLVQMFSGLVMPDGSGVIFHLSNDEPLGQLFPWLFPDPPEKGWFFVRADGTGLRRLGPPSRIPLWTTVPSPAGRPPLFLDLYWTGGWTLSHDGRQAVITDIGPDSEGRETPQIFLMDVFGPSAGRRTQVTHVPGRLSPVPTTCCGVFRDRRSIVFWTAGAHYIINVDGSGLRPLPSPFPTASGQVVPQFTIAGRGGNVRPLYLGGVAENVYPGVPPGIVREMFLLDGPRLLQLTNFRHSDTWGFLSRGRVFITTSADPLGTNPGRNCQLFSMNTRGGDLRQLTRFRDEGRPSFGCSEGGTGSACSIHYGAGSPVSSGAGISSNCNPLGTNPFGHQLFSMRANGTGLRQLTDVRGMEVDPDGTVHVELIDPAIQVPRFQGGGLPGAP
jgi:hypothetical protein